MAKPSARVPRSTLSSGLLTALSLAVVTGLSAAVGIVIAREFGRGVETDGFFSAYGVFLVLVLAASAVRVAVLPALARAREDGTFGSVFGSYALALAVVAVPALALGVLANDWAAAQLAGGLPRERAGDGRGRARLPRSRRRRAALRGALRERARRATTAMRRPRRAMRSAARSAWP